jgi:hypothetical protein
MMGRRRKIYVPITRSGPSILSSILTQLIQERRRELNAETWGRLKRKEISGPRAFLIIHPLICFFFLIFLVFLIGYLLGWVSVSGSAKTASQ